MVCVIHVSWVGLDRFRPHLLLHYSWLLRSLRRTLCRLILFRSFFYSRDCHHRSEIYVIRFILILISVILYLTVAPSSLYFGWLYIIQRRVRFPVLLCIRWDRRLVRVLLCWNVIARNFHHQLSSFVIVATEEPTVLLPPIVRFVYQFPVVPSSSWS